MGELACGWLLGAGLRLRSLVCGLWLLGLLGLRNDSLDVSRSDSRSDSRSACRSGAEGLCRREGSAWPFSQPTECSCDGMECSSQSAAGWCSVRSAESEAVMSSAWRSGDFNKVLKI